MAARKKVGDGLESVFDVDDLLAKYTPSPEPCIVTLPTGEKLTFKCPARKSELDAHLKEAAWWYSKLPKPGSPEEKGHNFEGLIPRSANEAIDAYTIAALSLEPKINQKQALLFLRAPWLVRLIVDSIDAHMCSMESMWALQRFEESKKKSETHGSGSD